MVSASVIISFYQRIDYLKMVLAGFERQSAKEFEIIIADDGSKQNVVEEIKNISGNYSFRITHLWQEDKAFRKNKILNKAIVAAESDYLIFIDGDCIPHREFVSEHIKYKKDFVCNAGRRVNLSEKITKKITPEKVMEGVLENNLILIEDGMFGETCFVEKGIYITNNILRKFINRKKRGILGCNFSINKSDILKINGFDERYEAPSLGEDSDVQIRLELMGVKINSLVNIAVQYHLYHKLQERVQVNLDLYEEVKKSGVAFTPFGISSKRTQL